VGDDERDIVAAHAAGMVGVAAAYGYLGGSDPGNWGAQISITRPAELVAFLPAALICCS
jgi:phosphoglycolate phosphatase